MYACYRIGDTDDYHLADSLRDAVESMAEIGVGDVVHWVDGGCAIGLETTEFNGQNCISLFWSDGDCELTRALDIEERRLVSAWLRELQTA